MKDQRSPTTIAKHQHNKYTEKSPNYPCPLVLGDK